MGVSTICLDCVFAEWDGLQQTQCEFDRLEKFVENGTEVVEEEDPQTGKKYFRIEGRICNTCRHPDTLKGVPARKWKDKVRDEVVPRISMAVYVDNDQVGTFSESRETLSSIVAQTMKPQEILLVYNNGGEDAPIDYSLWLGSNANTLWRVESIRGIPRPDGGYGIATYGDAVDLAVISESMKSTYFVVAKAGYRYPTDYIETIDRSINDDLNRFVALVPDEDGNGLFIQRGLHKLLQGNKPMHGCRNIMDKVRFIAGEENTHHMIQRFEDL